jgi:hypothetical protein
MSEAYKYNNPNGLLIGQHVLFERVCTVDYYVPTCKSKPHQRVLYYDPDKRGYARVVGCVKKGLGKYVPASRTGGFPFGPDDGDGFEPARLEVSRYVWLYELRKDIAGKTFLVHPDDIKMPSDHRVSRSEVLLGKMTEFLVKNMTPWEWNVIQKALKAPERS